MFSQKFNDLLNIQIQSKNKSFGFYGVEINRPLWVHLRKKADILPKRKPTLSVLRAKTRH